jgi:hypothetical protein
MAAQPGRRSNLARTRPLADAMLVLPADAKLVLPADAKWVLPADAKWVAADAGSTSDRYSPSIEGPDSRKLSGFLGGVRPTREGKAGETQLGCEFHVSIALDFSPKRSWSE